LQEEWEDFEGDRGLQMGGTVAEFDQPAVAEDIEVDIDVAEV